MGRTYLANIDGRIEAAAAIIQDIGAQQGLLARQQIHLHLRAGRPEHIVLHGHTLSRPLDAGLGIREADGSQGRLIAGLQPADSCFPGLLCGPSLLHMLGQGGPELGACPQNGLTC